MSILVVDDSPTIRSIIKVYLRDAGYNEVFFAETAKETFELLGIGSQDKTKVDAANSIDLILLDIVLPDMDGREACRAIKSEYYLQDIPVITVTSLTEMEHLEKAFDAGSIDYITKPINKIELLARIRSVLKLKKEMDQRKARERKLIEVTKQLEDAVEKLDRLSSLDGLTGIANRRRFDEYINIEWCRGRRSAKPLSLILIDIDFFKAYNDTYGHQAGDECLKKVANTLQDGLNRPADMACRYGGEEFAIILPETDKNGAIIIAKKMSDQIKALKIPHKQSQVSDIVTVSLGVASLLSTEGLSPMDLISAADKALYKAKNEGRNRIKVANVKLADN